MVDQNDQEDLSDVGWQWPDPEEAAEEATETDAAQMEQGIFNLVLTLAIVRAQMMGTAAGKASVVSFLEGLIEGLALDESNTKEQGE